jgi:hypothetical protein
MAWNVQNQLFIALRFFGLLKGDDEPTALLDDLVKGSEEERKAKFRKIAESAYSELIAIDLKTATRAHFEEKLGQLYNVTGDTRVKAIRFFLSAAAYVGLPLGSFIVPKDGKTKSPRRPRQAAPRAAKKTSVEAHQEIPKDGGAKPGGTSKSVNLASGGTLTLSATLDLFALNAADRAFVFGIIDTLEGYEQGAKT